MIIFARVLYSCSCVVFLVRYVIMAQMRALETPDPFNDDFYYHNAMRRKQERQHHDMLRGAEPHRTVSVSRRENLAIIYVRLRYMSCAASESVDGLSKKVIFFWKLWCRAIRCSSRKRSCYCRLLDSVMPCPLESEQRVISYEEKRLTGPTRPPSGIGVD